MTGSRYHLRRKASELVRCGGCNRPVQRATAREGPGGKLYGPECLPRASLLESRPLIPPGYMPDCADETCESPRDNVDWDATSEQFLCRIHRQKRPPDPHPEPGGPAPEA